MGESVMTKNIDRNFAAGRNQRKTVSQSLARKLLGRSAIGTIAAAVILPMASLAMLTATSVPAYAQAAGECRTATDDATIKAMQDLIASLDAELVNLHDQLTTADADAKDIQAQIQALDRKFADGDTSGTEQVAELAGKLADALQKVSQINGQISNDEA